MSRGVSIITIAIVLLLLLAFHYVTFGTGRGRKVCVVPKGHLTFDATLVSGGSEAEFALTHPYIESRIINGRGVCVSF